MADLAGALELAGRHAEESEAGRRLAAPVVAAMRTAGLFRMCLPASIGGSELDPPAVLAAIEQLAEVDGATGWCAMIASTSGAVSGHLPEPLAKQIYGPPDGLVVGPFAPLGKAETHPDGYLLSGRWPYASMCLEASWVMAGTVLPDGSRRLLFVPAGQFRIHDTWTVMGLAGTGSHDIEIDSALVAEAATVPLTFDAPVEPGPLYAFPVLGLLAAGIAAVTLGIARGSIDYLAGLAGRKTPTYAVRRLAERPAVQVGIASAEARLRAARGLLHQAVEQAWQAACADRLVPLPARVDLRLAAVHAAGVAAEVVTEMYGLGGGSSIYAGNPGQRRLRDVHTATQHVMVSPALLEVAGRAMLGLKVDPSAL